MKIAGDCQNIYDGIKELKSELPDIELRLERREKGFSVSCKDNVYTIAYATKTDFFRAYALLRGKISEGDFCIEQINKFDTCGIMIDVSRGAVLKIETVKDIIRYMANMGLNFIMLYTEDTYKIDEQPYFGYMRGAYTKEEIKEIVAYAGLFGIEVVPCIQTLAHLPYALRWRCADEIKDTDDILLIDEEKTYEFIEQMIKAIRESFTTDKIHIGMDEAHMVGLGRYLKLHGYHDRFELISRHLRRVLEITSKYGFKPMMWSDMFFRLGSKTGEYYDEEAEMPDNISEIIPQELSMVYWDYYAFETGQYEKMISAHREMQRPVIFAGGIWTWMGFSVHYDTTFATTCSGLEACIRCNVKDVFATIWGDDGAECSIYEALYGMQLYAEYNYSEKTLESLDEMFKICTGYDAEAFKLLSLDGFDEEPSWWRTTISKGVLYNDPLQGLLDKNCAAVNLKPYYKSILDGLDKLPSQNELEYLFDFHKKLVGILYHKCDINDRLLSAYASNDKEQLKLIADDFGRLAKDFEAFHEESAKIWYRNNKPFGYHRLDARLGGVESRLKRAKKRIEQYLCGEIPAIEELEEERLWCGKPDRPFEFACCTERIQG